MRSLYGAMRARKGMVIWIPSPEGEWMRNDHTLDAEALDRVAEALMEAGVPLGASIRTITLVCVVTYR